MTLIVGFLCSDGVVVGADSAATFGSAEGAKTIWQATDEKVRLVDDTALIATSGPIGLGQIFADSLGQALKDPKLKIQSATPASAGGVIADQVFRPNVQKVVSATAPAVPIVGNSSAFSKVASSSLVALSVSGGPRLYEYEWNGSPEQKTEAMPFVTIGSGQALADPFIAFLKKIFWEEGLPPLKEATFAVLWTLEQAIELAPGGLAPPVHLYWLSRDPARNGAPFTPRKLDDAELQEHRQAIKDAKDALHGFRDFVEAGDDESPEAPVPSA